MTDVSRYYSYAELQQQNAALVAEVAEWKERAEASPCKCADYEKPEHNLLCEYGGVIRELSALRASAAQDAMEADGYAGLLAERQLGRRAIEWIANGANITELDGHYYYCAVCDENADNVHDNNIKHKPDCLHLACIARLATATATATGAEGQTKQ